MTRAPVTIHDLENIGFLVQGIEETLAAMATSEQAQSGLGLSLQMLARSARTAAEGILAHVEQELAACRDKQGMAA